MIENYKLLSDSLSFQRSQKLLVVIIMVLGMKIWVKFEAHFGNLQMLNAQGTEFTDSTIIWFDFCCYILFYQSRHDSMADTRLDRLGKNQLFSYGFKYSTWKIFEILQYWNYNFFQYVTGLWLQPSKLLRYFGS